MFVLQNTIVFNLESQLLQQRKKREQKRSKQLQETKTFAEVFLASNNCAEINRKRKQKVDSQNYALRASKNKTIPKTTKSKSSCNKRVTDTRKGANALKSTTKATKATKRIEIGDCHHKDVHNLVAMPKADVKYYLQEDRFLANRDCLDCKNSFCAMVETANSTKIDFGLVFYCNNAMRCFHASDNDANRSCFECNLVICSGCYWKREAKCTQRGSKRSRRS